MQNMTEEQFRKLLREELSRTTYRRTVSGVLPVAPEPLELSERQRFWLSLTACGVVSGGWLMVTALGWYAVNLNEPLLAIGSLGSSIGVGMATVFSYRWVLPEDEYIEDEPETESAETPPAAPPKPQRHQTQPVPRPARRTVSVHGIEIVRDDSQQTELGGETFPLWRVQMWAANLANNHDSSVTIDYLKRCLGVGYSRARSVMDWLESQSAIDSGFLNDRGIDIVWEASGFPPLPQSRHFSQSPEVETR